MSTRDDVGLNIQDAWAEAEAEVDLSDETSEGTDIPQAEPVEESDVEQPNVESQEASGLFAGLEDDEQDLDGSQGGNEEQPDFRDSMHSVTVNGETFEVSYEELVNGYQRQAYTTQQQQEVSALRKEAENALVLEKALRENPVPTVKRLWEAVSRGETPVPDQSANRTRDLPESDEAGESDIDAIVQRKLEEALASDPRIKAIEEQRAVDEIDARFDAIEKDWDLDEPLNDDDKIRVLEEAKKTNNPDLEAVFAKMMHRRMKQDKQRENAEANSTATGYGGHPSVGAPSAAPEKFSSFRDAMNDTFVQENVDAATLDRVISNL